ncbi:hypothetical protein VULLAG_LOCUS5201 [Vulpes lagopus]
MRGFQRPLVNWSLDSPDTKIPRYPFQRFICITQRNVESGGNLLDLLDQKRRCLGPHDSGTHSPNTADCPREDFASERCSQVSASPTRKARESCERQQ